MVKQDWRLAVNKEEILEKSRKENKNKDIYEQEILKQEMLPQTL